DTLNHAKQVAESSDQSTRENINLAKQAANINKQQLVAVQRAFVHTPGLSLETVGYGDQTAARVQVRWINSGATPTKDLFLHVSFGAWTTPITSTYAGAPHFPDLDTSGSPTSNPEMLRSVLGPKAETLSAPVAIIPYPLMRQISDGKVNYYLWG